jgi:hypothetical protein
MIHRVVPLALLLASSLCFAASSRGVDPTSYDDMGTFAVIGKMAFPVNFGPTGMLGSFHGGSYFVRHIAKGSPADGVVKLWERIVAVNGRRITDDPDPRKALGLGITESEATTGELFLTVVRDGKEQKLTIRLPVMGQYSKTWPYNCEKSEKILNNACQWLADNQLAYGNFRCTHSDGTSTGPALNGLLLLASGDPKYLDTARRLAHYMVDHPVQDPTVKDPGGTCMWGWAYEGLFLSEYYLLTGDTYVISRLKKLCQIYTLAPGYDRGAWGHGFRNTGYAVGGYINHVGIICLTSLALMEEIGFDIDQEKLNTSIRYFRRWAEMSKHVHYGDHVGGHAWTPGGSSKGKAAAASVAFEILGDIEASKMFAQMVIDGYPFIDGCHSGPFLSLFLSPVGAIRARPDEFRLLVDHWKWFHDLSRRWDGTFMLPSDSGGGQYTARGSIFTMGGQALVYAIAKKKIRFLAAPESPFALDGMPEDAAKAKALVDRRKWYQAHAYLEELVWKGKASGRAKLMLESIKNTLASTDVTLAAIEKDLAAGDMARMATGVRNLENLLGPGHSDIRRYRTQIESGGSKHIRKNAELFYKHWLLGGASEHSRDILAKMAEDETAGLYRDKAKKALEDAKEWPSFADLGTHELLWFQIGPDWRRNKTDPYALGGMRTLAYSVPVLWPQGVAKKFLTKEGLLGDFPGSVRLLKESQEGERKWQSLAVDGELPEGWQKPDFDDSGWKACTAPVSGPTMKPKTVLLRTTFDVDDPDYDDLRVESKVSKQADIYLNGTHIARLLAESRPAYVDFEVSSIALPALRKGRNTLAVKVETGGKGFVDMDLLAITKNW